jgi:preprotein translocase subunit YajC
MNPTLLVWFVLLAAVFWFMILRPQRNAKRRASELSQSLDAGDEVVTIGGLYGRVVTIDDREVELEVADGVMLRFARRAIAGKVPAEIEEAEDDDHEDDELEGELDDDDEVEDDEYDDGDEIDDELEDDDESDDEPVSDAAPKADESIGR